MSGLFDTSLTSAPRTSFITALADRYRRRSEWIARFEHWQRPASVTEEGSLETAQKNVLGALAGATWMGSQGVMLHQQGSYFNNTNVRTEADLDLRLVHPSLKVDYAADVAPSYGAQFYGYGDSSLTYGELFGNMRAEAVAGLSAAFSKANVTVGKKAIRIKGITGSRAEVDVVPTVVFDHISWTGTTFRRVRGVAILSTENQWTMNFPEQHHANGKAKRERTRHRFKRMVRIFKRLRADMAGRGITVPNVPSFLIECLVYCVDDSYFLVESDDLYDRVRRIARQMHDMVHSPLAATAMLEINDVKLLFGYHQGWTLADAKGFTSAVVDHLGVD